MYLSLLAAAMDDRVATNAHPAFVEIIKQLSAEEAELIADILTVPIASGIVQLQLTTAGKPGYRTLATHVLNLRDETPLGETMLENPRLPAMVDNWVRLGLVEVTYARLLIDEWHYRWVDARPEVVRLRSQHNRESTSVTVEKGSIEATQLGRQFAQSVGMFERVKGQRSINPFSKAFV